MGISPNASDDDLAKQFVAFASSKATNEKLITTTGSGVDPIRTSTLDSEKYREFAPAVAAVAGEVFPNAQSWPTSPDAPEMLQALNDNLALMLQGSLTADKAMQQTWDAWQKLKG
jgi:multiple sugar transport system substrate-binding protein